MKRIKRPSHSLAEPSRPKKLTRRRFMQAAGVGAMALGFPTVLSSCGQGPSGGGGGGGTGSISLLVAKDTAHPQNQTRSRGSSLTNIRTRPSAGTHTPLLTRR